MKLGTLLLVLAVGFFSYFAGVNVEAERGKQIADDAAHFGLSIGYICGDFHDWSCFQTFKYVR